MRSAWVQAGVGGQQNLPDSFQVARATGSEAPQAVYINRELDLDVWQLADKVPGCPSLILQTLRRHICRTLYE